MDTENCRVALEVSSTTFDALVDDARKNKRSLRRQIEWILDRYVEAKEEDGA